MSSFYEVIDTIPDDDGDEVEVCVVGRSVMLSLGEGTSAVIFSAEGRDRFAKAWAEAGRRADAHQVPSRVKHGPWCQCAPCVADPGYEARRAEAHQAVDGG